MAVQNFKEIFVFGSNLAGRHGKGAALYAHNNHGAIYGQGVGLQGNSWAIPTKDENLKVLSFDKIEKYVKQFLKFAKRNKDYIFKLSNVGCGLAGYKPEQIAPLFKNCPDNIIMSSEFKKVIDGLKTIK